MRGISWLAAKPVSFSRRTLLHGVCKYIFCMTVPWMFMSVMMWDLRCSQMYVWATVTMKVLAWRTREDSHLAAALVVLRANTARRSQSLPTLLVVLQEQLFSSSSLFSWSGWFVLGQSAFFPQFHCCLLYTVYLKSLLMTYSDNTDIPKLYRTLYYNIVGIQGVRKRL